VFRIPRRSIFMPPPPLLLLLLLLPVKMASQSCFRQ
jgi:hypothetical protein